MSFHNFQDILFLHIILQQQSDFVAVASQALLEALITSETSLVSYQTKQPLTLKIKSRRDYI